ncbi:MAG: DUF6090 family protein [Balneolaceae bacterium]|nr:DUF6090 family protein [Balneolaceae bacterium]
MEQNKTRTYLLYALGEVLLVVIGILIALQINNWNESRIENQVLQSYYQQLLIDLENERVNLEDRIQRMDSSITAYDTYLQMFESQGVEADEILDAIGELDFSIEYVTFKMNTVETLQSTGDIRLMPINIRNAILDLQRDQERNIRTEANNMLYLEQQQKAYAEGWNPLLPRLRISNPELAERFDNGINWGQVLLTMEAAHMIKNYTEIQRVERFEKMLLDIEALEVLIQNEMKG